MPTRVTLKHVSTAVLEQLRDGISTGSLKPPVDRAALVGFGVRHQLDVIEGALAGHKTAACVAVLDVVLAEREGRLPAPELVWTGPEASAGTARDTAVVLRELFEGARQSVILAGYSFDHATGILAPLHRTMSIYAVEARFFVDVPRMTVPGDAEAHLARHLGGFMASSWPFGDPRPYLYYDKRAVRPGGPYCSLHAKCVVVDGVKAFVLSANFMQRGQERNIEVGVLIEDPSFAGFLAGQWMGLIEAGMVGEYVR
jgi:phosphatidylserine/phosphatidylglycerophosphate/cardiolipin synthase-like enzyme